MQDFARKTISPRLTSLYSKAGYLNRDCLSAGLRELTPAAGGHDDVLNLLAERGILKSNFRPAISDLNEIQPHMLGRIKAEQVSPLFDRTDAALSNIAAGLENVHCAIQSDLAASVQNYSAVKFLMAAASVGAVTIGLTLAGVNAFWFLAPGTAGAITCTLFAHEIKDPHSKWGKILKFGTLLTPVFVAANMLYGGVAAHHTPGGWWDDFKDAFSSVYLPFIGGVTALTAGVTYLQIRSAFNSRMATLHLPYSKRQIVTAMSLANAQILLKINYTAWRSLTFTIFGAGALLDHYFSSLPGFAALGVGLVARFNPWLDSHWRERKTEEWSNRLKARVDHLNYREAKLSDGRTVKIQAEKGTDNQIYFELKDGERIRRIEAPSTKDISRDKALKTLNENLIKQIQGEKARLVMEAINDQHPDGEFPRLMEILRGLIKTEALMNETRDIEDLEKLVATVMEKPEDEMILLGNLPVFLKDDAAAALRERLKRCLRAEDDLVNKLRSAFRTANRIRYSTMHQMGVEYVSGLGLKYGGLLALTALGVKDPLACFLDLATAYFGGWTLFADWHSGPAAIGSAINQKRSLFNVQEEPYISDSMRKKMTAFCTRLVAYIKEPERNLSKFVNMLMQEYPFVEVLLCGETPPYGDIKNVKDLRNAGAAQKFICDERDKIYDKFQECYLKLPETGATPEQDKAAAEALIGEFEKLGRLYYDIKAPDAYIPRLRAMIAQGKDPATQTITKDWFDLNGEEPFIRMTYEAIRYRGLFFREQARGLRLKVAHGAISHDELLKLYREVLDIFSVEIIHSVRKFDTGDDNYKTKTANLSTPETRLGDTFYQVLQLKERERSSPEDAGYDLAAHNVPATHVRLRNPNYNHRPGSAPENHKYLWVRREDMLEIFPFSRSMSNELKLVNNTPPEAHEKEFDLTVAGHALSGVRGFYSNEKVLPPQHLIDWHGLKIARDNLTWIAGEKDAPAGFKEVFRDWGRSEYGGKEYDRFAEKGALWFIDKPEVLVLAPAEYYNICDEAYIVINSERELPAELEHTARKDMLLRVVNQDALKADFPNPDPARLIDWVMGWRYQDASVGIRYKTADGQDFNIPYPESRDSFIREDRQEAGFHGKDFWKEAAYGRIKANERGARYLEAYSQEHFYLGRVKTEYPIHLHPKEKIQTFTEAGREYDIRFDVFADRTGAATWLVADYGDNYRDPEDKDADQFYNRHRFAFLDFDREAKQPFNPGFIVRKLTYDDNKRIAFTTLLTNCETLPVEKKFAGVDSAEELEALEINASGKIFYDPAGQTWSPVQDDKHTEELGQGALKMNGLLHIRKADGSEAIVPLRDLPRSLADPAEARKTLEVIRGEDGALTFVKLRRRDSIMDDPYFVYTLPANLYDLPDVKIKGKYQDLSWRLEKDDLTTRLEADGALRLFGEDGKDTGLTLDAADLLDLEGKKFLANPQRHMGRQEDFYQNDANNYEGTREYRPRLIKSQGEIKLILTRVEKVKLDRVPQELAGERPAKMFFSIPTSAARVRVGKTIKWLPLSLTKPISYIPTPDQAAVALTINGKTKYFNAALPALEGLPRLTYFLRYNKSDGKFHAMGFKKPDRTDNGDTKFEADDLGAVSAAIETALRKFLPADLTKAEKIGVEIMYTLRPEFINGEFHSVVHGQRQVGATYEDEAFFPTWQAQFRDEYFYGIGRELFSEASPPGRLFRAWSLQLGKTHDRDANGKYSGKPIENGTQFVTKHSQLFEMVEAAMGLPKGAMLAAAPLLDRVGAYEQAVHKKNFVKLVLYNRNLGWLSGVSEDEQGVLALALALGYKLRYHVKTTAFESHPTTYNQVNNQDNNRYNTALAQARDVLIPYELREIRKFLGGKPIADTWKQKYEHLMFRSWYEYPKAELARQVSPVVSLFSLGKIMPYFYDPYFMASWALDFALGIANYSYTRKMLGRNTEASDHGPLTWSMFIGPAMNQAFMYPALRGIINLFRKGWQYGAFVVTALGKASTVPQENKTFLKYLIGADLLAASYYFYQVVPDGVRYGFNPFDKGSLISLGWAFAAAGWNWGGLWFIKQCETGNSQNKSNEYGPLKFRQKRAAAVKKHNADSNRQGDEYVAALGHAENGENEKAIGLLQKIIASPAKKSSLVWKILAEKLREKLPSKS
ncbi:hypothetical protein A2625_01030 [candidate division WOR-1 bacterium RIFCSPHIGHO2_01_FULL_53_15]|uniref:Uncharacterized protein n=1 Tax=candidate division WOR-1 bacterium RIFCSPHIGHO2_01_FULL_53_15 TaxID=1802564 RepID=A0A1F4Q0N5_UNCSA|nr:MAG: hypothetical protein A2625_01030 [candidate division WOR-1 bacterium RIFCSPHIGHO2_01_FULL_53_15]